MREGGERFVELYLIFARSRECRPRHACGSPRSFANTHRTRAYAPTPAKPPVRRGERHGGN